MVKTTFVLEDLSPRMLLTGTKEKSFIVTIQQLPVRGHIIREHVNDTAGSKGQCGNPDIPPVFSRKLITLAHSLADTQAAAALAEVA